MEILASLVFMLCALTGCPKDGPQVTVYTSTPASGGMNYSDPKGNKGLKPYSQTDKYICFTPTEAQTLLNYCEAKGAKNSD